MAAKGSGFGSGGGSGSGSNVGSGSSVFGGSPRALQLQLGLVSGVANGITVGGASDSLTRGGGLAALAGGSQPSQWQLQQQQAALNQSGQTQGPGAQRCE